MCPPRRMQGARGLQSPAPSTPTPPPPPQPPGPPAAPASFPTAPHRASQLPPTVHPASQAQVPRPGPYPWSGACSPPWTPAPGSSLAPTRHSLCPPQPAANSRCNLPPRPCPQPRPQPSGPAPPWAAGRPRVFCSRLCGQVGASALRSTLGHLGAERCCHCPHFRDEETEAHRAKGRLRPQEGRSPTLRGGTGRPGTAPSRTQQVVL